VAWSLLEIPEAFSGMRWETVGFWVELKATCCWELCLENPVFSKALLALLLLPEAVSLV